MKNSIYTAVLLLSMGIALMACERESSDEIITHNTTPELEAQGQYDGTWTRTIQGDTLVVTAPGSIVLEPDTLNAYVGRVTFVSEEFDLNKSSIANIVYADKGFVYYNNNATNEMGTPFYGRIDGDSVNIASFELRIRVGRKFQYCNFSFEGPKTGPTL